MLDRPHPIHGFLFWGPEGVGKKTVADAFARGILCQKKIFGGCDKCETCLEFRRLGAHRDMIYVKPENGSISIEAVRDVILFFASAPALSAQKVAIIDDADAMSQEAQNAMLKIAEEPSERGVMILVSSSPSRIIETLRSRLVTIPFHQLPDKDIASMEELNRVGSQMRDSIVELADGRPGKAIQLVSNPGLLEKMQWIYGEVGEMTKRSIPDKILFAKRIASEGMIKDVCGLWLSRLARNLYSERDGSGRRAIANNARAVLNALILIEDTNVNPELLLENLLLWSNR